MHQVFLDAMAIVEALGAPAYFITFTCNPRWPEVLAALFPGQRSEDRPDVTTRVFMLKLTELLDDLKNKGIFGPAIGMIHVIEFQKRGLPHAHILLIVHPDHKPRDAADLDKYISAEIPNPETHPLAYETVKNSMIHGPCGERNDKSPCMNEEKTKCTKHYPKKFAEQSTYGANGYPEYRRRNNGQTIFSESFGEIDNCWVVPYNPFLAAKYNAHINVESCTSGNAILYLFKYVYKGPTRATIVLANLTQEEGGGDGGQRQKNEIKDFVDGRFIAPCEAVWRILGFRMHSAYPSVVRLHLHLPGQFMHAFRENEPLDDVLARAAEEQSTLTAYFKYNADHLDSPQMTYLMFPRTHVYNRSRRTWSPRKKGHAIGRMFFVLPSFGELFYLRLLLTTVESPKSFDDLKTLDGNLHNTFKDSCRARGLLESDEEWHQCLSTAACIQTGYQLRRLFVQILAYCNPSNPDQLWERYKDDLAFDLAPRERDARNIEEVQAFAAIRANKALLDIQGVLQRLVGKSLSDFDGMPEVVMPDDDDCVDNKLIADELAHPRLSDAEIAEIEVQLNVDQRRAYDSILNAVMSNSPEIFFIDGPAGTGKTFLYAAVLSYLRSKGYIALAVAGSGIAALLLQGGRTVHSRFKVPIPTLEDSTCNFTPNSELGELLKQASVIVWDEAPMTHRHVFETVDRSLRDLMKSVDPKNKDLPFGGKSVVFGGDFRQIPPVVKRGTREETIAASLKRSPLWSGVQSIELTINMRLLHNSKAADIVDQREYADWLLSVGDGTVEGVSVNHGVHTTIQLPPEVVMPADSTVGNLIDNVYPGLSELQEEVGHDNFAKYLSGRVILCSTNDEVDRVNTELVESMPGEVWDLHSADSIECDGDGGMKDMITPEFLHSLKSSSLPPHHLRLKVGCPVILLQNILPEVGLCNGTRLIVTSLSRYVIGATIINGPHTGTKHFILRKPIYPSDLDVPFKLRRLQFPIRAAFAITINKSQGQTLQVAGLLLTSPVFTHGQLYVALSRTTNSSNMFVLIESKEGSDCPSGYTTNVVYPEILA